MSINFATIQGLTIPEGVVTQITDASGNVLWSAGGKLISVAMSGSGGLYSQVVIDGTSYGFINVENIEVSKGTTMVCTVETISAGNAGKIYLNGVLVAQTETPETNLTTEETLRVQYEYVINKPIAIKFTYTAVKPGWITFYYGQLEITEL